MVEKILCAALGTNSCATDGRDSTLSGYGVTFTVVGSHDFGTAISLTLNGASGEVALTGLDPGVYTVCEIAVAQNGTRQVPLAVAEVNGCQQVTVSSGKSASVTFHDAIRTAPIVTPAPAPTKPVAVTSLPTTGAGGSRQMFANLWLLTGAAGVLLLAGMVAYRRKRRWPER